LFAGKGLTVCVSVIRGDYTRGVGEAMAAKQSLRRTMDEERVKGFVDVLVACNVIDGLSHLYVYSVHLLSKEMLKNVDRL
jgi:potassium/chloride transporter 4/5/6